MKKYQEKITSLIESGAYNEAAQLFCNETGTKIYIYIYISKAGRSINFGKRIFHVRNIQ